MKSIGMVRRLDELGRIVLPIELRRSLDLNEKDLIEIYVDGERIILRKHAPGCCICGEIENGMRQINEKNICPTCAQQIKEAFRKL